MRINRTPMPQIITTSRTWRQTVGRKNTRDGTKSTFPFFAGDLHCGAGFNKLGLGGEPLWTDARRPGQASTFMETSVENHSSGHRVDRHCRHGCFVVGCGAAAIVDRGRKSPAKPDGIATAGSIAVDPAELSGGGQIANFSEPAQSAGWAEYDLAVPAAGSYQLLAACQS